jgi:hypothetical protein
MTVRRQVLCKECGASHNIRRHLKPGVIYRFFCKACGAFVSFDRSQVRWATSEGALRVVRSQRASAPAHDTVADAVTHDTLTDRPISPRRRIWEGTTLVPSEDMGATLDGVQGIWHAPAEQPRRRPSAPLRCAPPLRLLPVELTPTADLPATERELPELPPVMTAQPAAALEIEVRDEDIVDTVDLDLRDAASADEGLDRTITDERAPVHVTPLLPPARETTPVESTRVRWLRHMLRQGAA